MLCSASIMVRGKTFGGFSHSWLLEGERVKLGGRSVGQTWGKGGPWKPEKKNKLSIIRSK